MRRAVASGAAVAFAIGLVVAIVFLQDGKEDEYSKYPHYPFHVSISANGSYIVARYRAPESFVQLFGRENNSPLWSISPDTLVPSYWTEASAISADGNYIVVGTRERLYLFSKDNNEPLWSYPIHVEPEATAISSDGFYIAAGTNSGLYLFKREDNAPFWSSPVGEVKSISMSSDGIYVIAGAGGTLHLFDQAENVLSTYAYPDKSVSISSDGSCVAVGEGHYLYLFNRADNTQLWSYEFSENHNLTGGVLISANGNYVIVDGGGTIYSRISFPQGGWGELHLFSKTENVLLWSHKSDGWVGRTYSSISSDGNSIVVGHQRKFYLFSHTSNAPIWSYTFPEHTYGMSVSLSADGGYIVVGTEGGPAPNIGGSVYLFSKESNVPVWSYHHEVEPYSYV